MTRPTQRSLLTLSILLIATAAVIWLQGPPTPVSATAPADVFSAERAMVHVREIARAPHPPGTAEHTRVRDYLVAEFKKLGFATEIQKRLAYRKESGRGLAMASVENVIAEKPGSAKSGILLLTAHYDSHLTGPGAGDDAAGVAALLEAARALEPGRNTLRILITDGEEMGLLGAQGYVDALTEKVPTLVLNFEARGGGGPVFMFETSEGNLPLIPEFATAAPSPHASSLMYALYKTLPNDTDLTVFKRAGMAGLNFAFVGNWQHYHTRLDTPENLDQRSLQQQGATALALSRRFLEADLARLTRSGQGDSIYFDLLGRTLLHYPATLIWPLTGIALLAFAAVLWHLRQERGTLQAFFSGMGLAAGTLMVGALTGLGFGALVQPFRQAIPNQDPYGVRWFEASLCLVSLALITLIWGWALRRFEGKALALGALLWWLLALVASTAFLPGGTDLFLWPLLLALLGLWLGRPWVAALPLLLLFVPLWHNLTLLLGFSLPAFLGTLAAFGLIPLLPLWRHLCLPRLALVPGLLLGIGVLCFGVGARKTGPKVDTLVYLEDAATHQAQWVSFHRPDAWTQSFLGEHPAPTRLAHRPAFAAPAPLQLMPSFTLLHEGHHLTLNLPEGALDLVFEADKPLARVSLDGQRLPLDTHMHWFAPPRTMTFTIEAQAGTSLTVDMILPGLPPGTLPRPAEWMSAGWDPYTDTRILRQVLRL